MKTRKFEVTLEVEVELKDYESEGIVESMITRQLPDYIDVKEIKATEID